jgi:hypothetical protein
VSWASQTRYAGRSLDGRRIISLLLSGVEGGHLACHLYVVVLSLPTTILPPTHRPGDRRGSSSRRASARHDEAHNQSYVETNNVPSDDASNCWKNVSTKGSSDASCSDGFNLWSSSRFGTLFSYRRACRRSWLSPCRNSARHSERYSDRYFVTNNDGRLDGLNRFFGARYQFPGSSFQLL